jgi:hypothetical protein
MAGSEQLQGIPFAEVVRAATGRRVVPLHPMNELDRALIARIGGALDAVLERLNAPDSPAQTQRRINEVSAQIESVLREALNRVPGFRCDIPVTAAGRSQRSGYPDLRLLDQASGRVLYLDPKLSEQGSRGSSLRTFYFEPKRETNKILDDAHHLLVGIEHDGGGAGRRRFLRWDLVDLSSLRVRLKAEFQASNKELYQPESILRSSMR